jgi:hypothetical protein
MAVAVGAPASASVPAGGNGANPGSPRFEGRAQGFRFRNASRGDEIGDDGGAMNRPASLETLPGDSVGPPNAAPHAASLRSAQRRPRAFLAGLLVLTLAVDASAANPEATRAAKDAARLLVQGKVAEACALFAESQRLDPKPATQLSLAKCQERAGQLGAALATYRALAAGAPSTYQITASIARKALEKKMPKLVVTVGAPRPPDLRVERDGALVDAAEWSQPLAVEPGAHTITATARGKRPWTATVTVAKTPVTVVVPPLQDDVVAVGSQGTALSALGRIGGASWSEGVGFVLPGDPPPPPTVAPPPTMPTMQDDDLSHVGAALDVGALLYLRSPGVLGGVSIRPEFRHRSSWVAPWFDIAVEGGYLPQLGTGLVHVSTHVGVDVHPARLPQIGFGPFVGYGVFVFKGNALPINQGQDQSTAQADHGPDLGPLNIHFRTTETEAEPPIFDADAYVLERLALRLQDKATYVGLRLGVGREVRFRAFVEGRVAVDRGTDLALAQQLHAGIGIGGAQ